MTSDIDRQTRLATLTVEIKQALALARHHGKITLSALMDAGDRLTEAKASFPHGEWDDWLRDNFDLSDRTARLYMQLAGHRVRVEAKMATVADLGIRGALDVIHEDQMQECREKENRERLAQQLASRPEYYTGKPAPRSQPPSASEREHDLNEMQKAVRHLMDHMCAVLTRFKDANFSEFRPHLDRLLNPLGLAVAPLAQEREIARAWARQARARRRTKANGAGKVAEASAGAEAAA